MGLFDKKNCDICGEKIGLLGNRKLDDGNLCKNCASKLSPWFEERRHSTVEDIKRQLAYREENKNAVRSFSVTREFSADRYHVFIDDNKGMFAVAFNMSEQDNPDIVPLSAITSCRLDIDEQRVEEEYKDQNGESRSYVPPRYNYSYDYKIKLGVNTPWFDDMDFKLNTFSVKDHEQAKMMNYEQLASQIITALTGAPAPAPIYGNGMMNQRYPQQGGMMNQGYPQQGNMMNQGYPQQGYMMNQGYPQQGNMMNQGYPQQGNMMNQGYPQQNGMMSQGYPQQGNMMNQGYPQQGGMMNQGYPQQGSMMNQGYPQQVNMMNQNAPQHGTMMNQNTPQQASGDTWVCACGATNTGAFCEYCGSPKP
jgi:hypothetical protein